MNSAKTTKNYGGLSTLRAQLSSGSDPAVYRTYMTFTVTTLPATTVKLRLFVTDASDNGGLLYPVAGTWTESAITWSTAPAITTRPIGSLPASPAGTWTAIDVSRIVTRPGTYSFAIGSPSTNSVAYASRETANAPTLVVGG